MKQLRHAPIAAGLLICALGLTSSVADEGRVLVSGPIAIVTPGQYVVTRDFQTDLGSPIRVYSDGVTLHLNGKTITVRDPAGAGVLVSVLGTPLSRGVTVRNGFIVGGGVGISAQSDLGGRVRIENLTATGQANAGIVIRDVDEFAILDCSISDSASYGIHRFTTASRTATGRIVRTTIRNTALHGMRLLDVENTVVRGNHVTDVGDFGINLGGSQSRVTDNEVHNVTGAVDGDGIAVLGEDNLVARNSVSDAADRGIRLPVGSVRGTVQDNVVIGSGGNGIEISSDAVLVEGNHVTGSAAYGIYASATTHPIAYRNNVLRDNTSGPVGEFTPTSADDLGGNICDGPCP